MKKTNQTLGKVTALFLAVVLLTTGFCCTALAAGENLLASYDPGFESVALEGDTAQVLAPRVYKSGTAEVISTAAHEGSKSMSLPKTGDLVKFDVRDLSPATNYTFTFWMKNSVADSLTMAAADNTFTVDGKLYKNLDSDIKDSYTWYIATFGLLPDTATFGAERTGEAMNTWRKVSLNFTTPLEGFNGVILTLKCATEDPVLAIDDLSLVATGKNLQRAVNGDFEAIDASRDIPRLPYISGDSGTSTWGTNLFVREDSQTGNHYVELEGSGGIKVAGYPLYMKGDGRLGKRHKISFKMKTPDEGKRVFLKFEAPKNTTLLLPTTNEFPRAGNDTWETYSMYIDATKLYNAGKTEAPKNSTFVGAEGDCFDDLFFGFDESSIGFYKELSIDPIKSGSSADTNGDGYFTNAILTEKGIEAESLSKLPEEEGYRTVKTRAHYLPLETLDADGKGTGAFSEQSVMLITGVYEYEEGKAKTLIDIDVKTGSSADGSVVDVVGEVKVPVNAGGKTYKVEAMAWNPDTMQPLMDKAVLD